MFKEELSLEESSLELFLLLELLNSCLQDANNKDNKNKENDFLFIY